MSHIEPTDHRQDWILPFHISADIQCELRGINTGRHSVVLGMKYKHRQTRRPHYSPWFQHSYYKPLLIIFPAPSTLFITSIILIIIIIIKNPWSESASELYRPSDRRLSAKWLPTCADRRSYVVSVTDPYGRILGFLDNNNNNNNNNGLELSRWRFQWVCPS
jgi:hypothetical protein